MDEVGAQARFYEESAAVRARADLRLLLVHGEDARDWLNGQVTNDVRSTQRGDTVYALVIDVKGKILADAWVLDRGDSFSVALPTSAWATTLERLESQIFMEDVELETSEDAIVSVQGPHATEVVREASADPARVHRVDELGTGGVFVTIAPEAVEATLASLGEKAAALGGGVVGEPGFELARLRRGRPRFAVDFGERVFPQEAGLKALAVSFGKGCYVGQEAVVMLEHRGRVRQSLVRLESASTLAPGDALTDAEGKEVGTVTSATQDPESHHTLALGYVKRDAFQPGSTLKVGNTAVTMRGLAGAG